MDLSAARDQLSERLATLDSGTLLIEGPTLVGKTALIEALKTDLQNREIGEIFIDTIACSQSHAGYEPILDSVEKLSKRENWALKKRAGRIARAFGIHGLSTVGGMFRRFFPDAIPKEALESLRSGLDSIINDQTKASASPEFPRSEKSKLANTLRDVIEISGRRLVLFVDRLEELPTPGIKLLQFIAETAPANVVIILAASSDSTAYYERQDIRELTNTCKKNGEDAICKIDGYSPASLAEMRQGNGYPTSLEAAQQAFEFSLGGRIGLVESWLNSGEDNISRLKPAADRLVAHYAIQYDRLADPHKNVVRCLAAVYPNGLSLHQLAVLMERSIASLDEHLRKVHPFTEISNQTVTLKNRHVLYFIRTSTPGAIVQASYDELQNRVKKLAVSGLDDEVGDLATPKLLSACLPQCLPAMDSSTVLREAREFLERGASKAAINHLEAWRGWEDCANKNQETEAEILLLEADAFGQLGAYQSAIDRLKRMPPVTNLSVENSLSLGEKYYRVGLHKEAAQCLGRARRESRRFSQTNTWVKAVARTLSVRNELSSGRRSKLLGNCLATAIKGNLASIEPRTQSLAYRALARTYALTGTSHSIALECANRALEIATEITKSDRDLGNARYALADVYRHTGQIDKALHEFEHALEIGTRTDNYDLQLYALLGKAACFLATCDTNSLSRAVTALEELVAINESSPEYKIVKLFGLVEQRLNGKKCYSDKIDASFVVIGRPWTSELQSCLADQTTDFKVLLKKLVVVL